MKITNDQNKMTMEELVQDIYRLEKEDIKSFYNEREKEYQKMEPVTQPTSVDYKNDWANVHNGFVPVLFDRCDKLD